MSPVECEPGVAETELVELGKSDTETSLAALAVWLAPDEMTAKVHEFDGPSWRRISDVAVLSLIQKM
jgi:hypothetical protein